jgi:hypothetical protein
VITCDLIFFTYADITRMTGKQHVTSLEYRGYQDESLLKIRDTCGNQGSLLSSSNTSASEETEGNEFSSDTDIARGAMTIRPG